MTLQTAVKPRRRLSTAERESMQLEALSRATGNLSTMNYGDIIRGFAAKGIPVGDICPRENVFTYHAWRALGRQVKRGEKGVKVITWIPIAGKEQPDGTIGPGRKVCRSAVVFHVSQTELIAK